MATGIKSDKFYAMATEIYRGIFCEYAFFPQPLYTMATEIISDKLYKMATKIYRGLFFFEYAFCP